MHFYRRPFELEHVKTARWRAKSTKQEVCREIKPSIGICQVNEIAKMKKQKLNRQQKKDKTRIRIYEAIGIRVFRKMLFSIEAARHRKDGRTNRNYHFRDASTSSLQYHKGYLLYNAFLHIVSIAFIAIYYLIASLAGYNNAILNVLMVILFLINLYCILLQRYVFLRIRFCLYTRAKKEFLKEAEAVKIIASRLETQDRQTLFIDYEILKTLKESITSGTMCYLDDADAVSLRRIAETIKPCYKVKHSLPISQNTLIKKMIEGLTLNVVSPIDQRVSRLQKIFNRKTSYGILHGCSIVTTSKHCESAYRELLYKHNRDEIETKLNASLKAYMQVLEI